MPFNIPLVRTIPIAAALAVLLARDAGAAMAQTIEGMHDQIVKQWTYVRSYVLHLFLALMADGGIYEFEPLAAPKP